MASEEASSSELKNGSDEVQAESPTEEKSLEESSSECSVPEPSAPSKSVAESEVLKCNYSRLGDRGIIHNITGGNHRKDDCGIAVTASSVAIGDPIDFIGHEKTRCWTQNLPYSWFCVDFGTNRLIVPSYYSFGYGSSGSACLPRFWLLQGAKKLSRINVQYESSEDTPQNDPDWKTLAIHNNDSSLSGEWGQQAWRLNCRDAYRYFRVVQTGPNSYNSPGDDHWSQVMVVNRFELYGTIYPTSSSSPPTASETKPMRYGTSSTNKYVPPPLIRASPAIMREIQELMAHLLKPQNENKPERVKVHDIRV
eukprot:TRINITY_DN2128_c0_g1_i1.p1 TRINITY_DN2128_c0_g1~~TRINITY_DN2128_c0_g1_i1.p1  ORF type:complete len:309 (+),score=21.68 TRINITY_DN2128_c0_g1_i1:116-1042(+)